MRSPRSGGPRVAPGSGQEARPKLRLRSPLPARSEHYTMVEAAAAAAAAGRQRRRKREAGGGGALTERAAARAPALAVQEWRAASEPPASSGPRAQQAPPLPGPAPSPGGPGRRDKCRAGPRPPQEQEGAGRARETSGGSAAHGSLSSRRALYFLLRKGLRRWREGKRHSGQGTTTNHQ